MNPFLTVYGPRPETWWAVCNLCQRASAARFESEAAAAAWEHDCVAEADDGQLCMTVTVAPDDPPAIEWKGQFTSGRLDEIRAALDAMHCWSSQNPKWRRHASWVEAVADGWTRTRKRATDRVIAEFEHAVSHPFVCPGCTQRCMTVGGLKNHMRACWKIDPFKFKRGEYDDSMVPGGAA